MSSKRIIFTGRVQGVGFRYTTKEIALGFDVCGWVRNLFDGSVEMHLMGEEDEVEDYLREIIEESTVARFIKDVKIEDIPPLKNAVGFRITQ
jgi:acylphosphatase